jgi:autotransporter-associated beta strand protein
LEVAVARLFEVKSVRECLLAAALLFPFVAAAQTLTITNGIQTYTALTNTTVTMSGQSELRVTAASDPIPGCVFHLNSPDAWFFLPGIRPSVVASTYLSQVRVNGANAVSGANVRVVGYAMGTVIIPHASSFQPLQVFTGTNFTGTSSYLSQYTAYADAGLGTMNNNISSFKLKRGYTATFAQNGNGTGLSKNFVAQDGDLNVSIIPAGLDNSVSFIRVFPWRWTAKKGIAGDIVQSLNLRWYYNWSLNQNSSFDLEYVPIRQNRWWPDLNQNWQARGASQLLGYNEPDRPDQANMSIGDAISAWPDLLATGLRVGAPAVSDGGRSSWLYPFIQQANAAGLRVDFVPVHYYWCYDPADPSGAATQMYNFLKATYDQVKRPLWVTEWNNGANWTPCADPSYAQQQACISAMVDMLEDTPFVERYALFNWVEDVRRLQWDDGSLTSAGTTYRDKSSAISYVQEGLPGGGRSLARFQFENDVLDSSGTGNNGIAVGIPGYTTGTNGQAIQLDGTNSYVVLPSNTANSAGFSFAAWVYWEGGGNWQRIFDFGNDTTQYMFLTPSSGSGTLRFAIALNGPGSEQMLQTTVLPVGQWRHVAVALSNNTARLYVNGALAASSTGFSILPSQFSPRRNYLGKSQFKADPLFRGRLDEVILAHYALSAAEIAALQTNQPPVFQDIGDGVWIADASGTWSNPANWSGGLRANGPGYTADFSALDITANRIVTLDSSRSIGALKFGDTSGPQSWSLSSSGSVLTLDSGSSTQPSITMNQNTATISASLAGINGLSKTGSGTLVLSGSNTLSGSINIDTSSTTANEGIVRAAHPNALANIGTLWIRNNNGGSSTLQLDGSQGSVTGPQSVRLAGRNNSVVSIQNLSGSNSVRALTIDVGGSSYLLQSDAGTLNLAGTVSSLASGTRTFTFQGNGNFNVSGSIQNGSATTINLSKTNAGALTIAGASTFSGTTTNWRGNLFVNGSLVSPVTVIGGTVGGNGSISGAVVLQSGASLSPGVPIGVLTVSNSVTLQPGSTTFIELEKSIPTNDLLRVTGALNYGGTLIVTNLGGTLMPGDSFKLFQAAAYNNSFGSITLPALATGLSWNTAGLTTGVVSVVATARPQFISVTKMSDGNFQLSGAGAAFANYELWATINLTSPIGWLLLTNAVADTNGMFNLTDPAATNYPQRFYRIVSP